MAIMAANILLARKKLDVPLTPQRGNLENTKISNNSKTACEFRLLTSQISRALGVLQIANKKFGICRKIIPLEGAESFDRGRLKTSLYLYYRSQVDAVHDIL